MGTVWPVNHLKFNGSTVKRFKLFQHELDFRCYGVMTIPQRFHHVHLQPWVVLNTAVLSMLKWRSTHSRRFVGQLLRCEKWRRKPDARHLSWKWPILATTHQVYKHLTFYRTTEGDYNEVEVIIFNMLIITQYLLAINKEILGGMPTFVLSNRPF